MCAVRFFTIFKFYKSKMMKRKYPYITVIILLLISSLVCLSCKDDNRTPEWEWGDDDDEVVESSDKPRYIWVDAAANFPDFADSKENILRDLTLAKEAGFTDVVVDVRPTSGDVLFQTSRVDQVTWLGAWLPQGYSKVTRTATWDYLQAFIDAGHSLGLKIHAGINTMVGANFTTLGQEGMLYRDASKSHWATQLLTTSGVVSVLDQNTTGAKFFNPIHDEVQEFLFGMLEDLASYSGLDGIVLDRCRYDELDSDFSNYSKSKFEAYLGYTIQNFPDDVMKPEIKTGSLPSSLPPYFKQWLEFRAKTIHDFMEKARGKVKAKNPNIQFGVYVGGWYSTYYGVGVNWASPKYNTSTYYSTWATSSYKDYGFADHMDLILIGAYAAPTRINGTSEWTVKGFCSLAVDKIKGDAIVVGGPDVGNGDWATASDATVNQAITQSVDAAMSVCDGYFLFDMIHLKKKNQWQYVKAGIDAAIAK